jgi:hypothetical protein
MPMRWATVTYDRTLSSTSPHSITVRPHRSLGTLQHAARTGHSLPLTARLHIAHHERSRHSDVAQVHPGPRRLVGHRVVRQHAREEQDFREPVAGRVEYRPEVARLSGLACQEPVPAVHEPGNDHAHNGQYPVAERAVPPGRSKHDYPQDGDIVGAESHPDKHPQEWS